MSPNELAAPRNGDVVTLKEFASEMIDYTPMRLGQVIFTKGVKVRVEGYSRSLRATGAQSAELVPADYVERVTLALRDGRWDFRTVESLAKTTQLSEDAVRTAVAMPGVARRPWRRSVDLFAPADRQVSVREVASLLRVFASKRP